MLSLLYIFALLINPVQVSDWELRKNEEKIIVYTREVAGSSFAEFKAITEIEHTTMENVLNIILDVNNYDKLFPDCRNPKILKQEGKYYDIHYIEAVAPWPVTNRDAIYEQITILTENGKKAKVTLKPMPDYIAVNKNIIRIQKGTGFWELEEIAINKIKVTYQFHGEPAGSIPAWLANSFVVDHPYKTLQNLKNRVIKN